MSAARYKIGNLQGAAVVLGDVSFLHPPFADELYLFIIHVLDFFVVFVLSEFNHDFKCF